MPNIDDYRFGHIVIDGLEHTRDVIVLPDRVVDNWWRVDGHSLVIEDLADVLDDLPERLVVGTGAYGRMEPDPNALNELRSRGIEIEVLETAEAVRRYSALDAAATAAALHLTC
ncbi:MAG: MTH938/NDUFAF3 family protein [Actinomycetota bacterium]